MHTSGHATVEDIRQMILTVKPQKYIVPIHTEEPEAFKQLDIGYYSNMIEEIDDSEILEI